MSSRHYSSFLLRLWSVKNADDQSSDSANGFSTTVLQIQNLQTGQTWRLNTLNELNELLGQTLTDEPLPHSLKALLVPTVTALNRRELE